MNPTHEGTVAVKNKPGQPKSKLVCGETYKTVKEVIKKEIEEPIFKNGKEPFGN